MNEIMKFEPYSHTTKFFSLYDLSNMQAAFCFLKCLLNDIFYLTDTDIFASFIREMIYKKTHIKSSSISEEMLFAPCENYCSYFATLIC